MNKLARKGYDRYYDAYVHELQRTFDVGVNGMPSIVSLVGPYSLAPPFPVENLGCFRLEYPIPQHGRCKVQLDMFRVGMRNIITQLTTMINPELNYLYMVKFRPEGRSKDGLDWFTRSINIIVFQEMLILPPPLLFGGGAA